MLRWAEVRPISRSGIFLELPANVMHISKKSEPGNDQGFTLIEIMVVVIIIGLVLAIAVPYYVAYKRTTCDRAANADIATIAAAIERFKTEMDDLNCSYQSVATNVGIGWLVGPYYGWGGTNRKCEVYVRRGPAEFSHEAWACAVRGSHPVEDPGVRFVYRTSLAGGPELPLYVMSCPGTVPWSAYGGRGEFCYTSSMLKKKNCTPSEPDGKIDCALYTGTE